MSVGSHMTRIRLDECVTGIRLDECVTEIRLDECVTGIRLDECVHSHYHTSPIISAYWCKS